MGLGSLHPIEHGFSTGRGGASLHNIEQGHSLVIPKSLIGVLRKLQLTTNLKLVLDAGDASSYTSGQSWLDRSGGGYDFFLGIDADADPDDPTFNGTAGGLSSAEFFSFDGGDGFQYDSAVDAWMSAIHQDSAKYTMLFWVYLGSATNPGSLAGTGNNNSLGSNFDFRFVVTTALVRLRIHNTTGSAAKDLTTAAAMPIGAWAFVALTLDETVGANGAAIIINSTVELFNSTYTSPSAAAADYPMQISGRGQTTIVNPLASGSRMGGVAMWQGTALTTAQLAAIYTATRGRYGV